MKSLIKHCTATLCICFLSLTGCTTHNLLSFWEVEPTVKVFNSREFSRFLSQIGSERIEHNLAAPVVSRAEYEGEYIPKSFGNTLYSRLSLRFLWPAEERKRTKEHMTHADIPSTKEALQVTKYAFNVNGDFGKDSYQMVALLDWNQDGKRDWLIRYTYSPVIGDESSSRFIIVPSPAPSGILDAEVVLLRECAYGKCKSYSGKRLTSRLGYKQQS